MFPNSPNSPWIFCRGFIVGWVHHPFVVESQSTDAIAWHLQIYSQSLASYSCTGYGWGQAPRTYPRQEENTLPTHRHNNGKSVSIADVLVARVVNTYDYLLLKRTSTKKSPSSSSVIFHPSIPDNPSISQLCLKSSIAMLYRSNSIYCR